MTTVCPCPKDLPCLNNVGLCNPDLFTPEGLGREDKEVSNGLGGRRGPDEAAALMEDVGLIVEGLTAVTGPFAGCRDNLVGCNLPDLGGITVFLM